MALQASAPGRRPPDARRLGRCDVPLVALALTLGLADVSLAAALTGHVADSATGRPIATAKLELLGQQRTASTADDGSFVLDVPAWPATLVATRQGYRVARIEIAQAPTEPLALRLDPVISYSDRIEVTATRAREGIDPATFTNIPQERIQESYWGQDPAMLLPDLAPGFLAYNDSGNGIGYSYFTVRGFGQARTRVTLNGAPLNDAESGELFFIDLADFLSTAGDVQLGRGVFGLSGIGGSLDITTASAALEPSFTLHGGAGSFGTRRLVARYDSGLVGGDLVARRPATRGSRPTAIATSPGSRCGTRSSRSRASARARRCASTSSAARSRPTWRTTASRRACSTAASPATRTATGARTRSRYPGELDEFVQPHFQLAARLPARRRHAPVADVLRVPRRRLLRPAAVAADARRVQPPRRRAARRDDDPGERPRAQAQRRRVGLRLGADPHATAGRASRSRSRGELRLHEAHHVGEVKWAQYYPAGSSPTAATTTTASTSTPPPARPRLAWDAGAAADALGRPAAHARALRDVSTTGSRTSRSTRATASSCRASAPSSTSRRDATPTSTSRAAVRAPNVRQIYDPQDYWSAPASTSTPRTCRLRGRRLAAARHLAGAR